jgi:hypothetical protein
VLEDVDFDVDVANGAGEMLAHGSILLDAAVAVDADAARVGLARRGGARLGDSVRSPDIALEVVQDGPDAALDDLAGQEPGLAAARVH